MRARGGWCLLHPHPRGRRDSAFRPCRGQCSWPVAVCRMRKLLQAGACGELHSYLSTEFHISCVLCESIIYLNMPPYLYLSCCLCCCRDCCSSSCCCSGSVPWSVPSDETGTDGKITLLVLLSDSYNPNRYRVETHCVLYEYLP